MKYLLVLWLINTSELPTGSWAYINRYFSTLEDCTKRGEHEELNMPNVYDHICVPRRNPPSAA